MDKDLDKLNEAIETIRDYCSTIGGNPNLECSDCILEKFCEKNWNTSPCNWDEIDE